MLFLQRFQAWREKRRNIAQFKLDVDRAYGSGWTPKQKIFANIEKKECCPAAASCLINGIKKNFVWHAGRKYKLPHSFILGLTLGWDLAELDSGPYCNDFLAGYRLGLELYEKYFEMGKIK